MHAIVSFVATPTRMLCNVNSVGLFACLTFGMMKIQIIDYLVCPMAASMNFTAYRMNNRKIMSHLLSIKSLVVVIVHVKSKYDIEVRMIWQGYDFIFTFLIIFFFIRVVEESHRNGVFSFDHQYRLLKFVLFSLHWAHSIS